MEALVALSDGTVFSGTAFGAPGESLGQMVFNTSMTGYQEILTDPSYACQIVCMTYPMIGNYGITPKDEESSRPQVRGFIVKECSRIYNNWRAQQSLPDYLQYHSVIGIEGIDTRELTRKVRIHGTMNAILSTEDLDPDSLVKKAKDWEGLDGLDMASQVSCQHAYTVNIDNPSYHVVALDFGIKRNIIECLNKIGCNVTVVPAKTTANDILALNPDGIFLSNGPGDPRPLHYAVSTSKELIGQKPIFGICLGHEILGLAFGAKIIRLKYGHRGANQPIKDRATGQILITSENHGWAIDPRSLPSEVDVTRSNLNDGCVEGLAHKELPVFSIQCHPEASPGPHDSMHLFNHFAELMKQHLG